MTGRDATYDGADWRWAADGDPADANVVASDGFVRALFAPERTPVGVSVGRRCVDFWRFADAELGTNIGPLTAPTDVSANSVVDPLR